MQFLKRKDFKMKWPFGIVLSFFLSIFCTENIQCQVVNFLRDSSRWVYITSESTEPNMQFITNTTEQFAIQGDTILNNTGYKKLYNKKIIETVVFPGTGTQYSIFSYDSALQFIRFDSIRNEVFLKADTGTVDHLLYSYNQTIGDTLVGIYSASEYIIDSIEPVTVFGIQTSKIYTSKPPPWNYFNDENYQINGIGSSNGLLVFHPVEIVVSGGVFMTRLICFQQGDSVFYGFNQIDCPVINFPNSIGESEKNSSVLIYPNPFQNRLNIYLGNLSEHGQIDIYNTLGEKVYSGEFEGNIVSVNSNLTAGVYFIQIISPHLNYRQRIIRN